MGSHDIITSTTLSPGGGLTRRGLLRNGALFGAGALTAGTWGRGAFAANRGYQWASSALGSTGYVIVSVLAAAASEFSELRNSSMATSGASENMILIGTGVADFGQTTSADYKPAAEGTGQFEGSPVEVWQMFTYTVWQLSPMVRADSGIESLADLAGKRVMPMSANGTTHIMWRDLFEAAGIGADEIDWSHGSWNETYDAIRAGSADCIPVLLTNGRPSARVTELEASGTEMRILDIPEEAFAAVRERNPGILSSVIEPGKATTAYVTQPTRMITLSGILGVAPEVPQEDAYTIIKAIMENVDWIKSKGSELEDIDPGFGAANLMTGFPVHPGAVRYFREAGLWRDELMAGG